MDNRSKLRKYAIPVLVLGFFLLLSYWFMTNKPEAKRWNKAPKSAVTVEVEAVKARRFSVDIDSFGTVRPRTESALVSQVTGQIIEISRNLRDGGFFEKGEVLAVIDPRDFNAQVKIAESDLLQAELALEEERARSVQAQLDWKRLGSPDEAPPALVLRKPQMAAAQAVMYSKQANLEKAQLDLERTRIVAPFAGRVLNKNADVGQVVNSSTELASIYAIDYVEIRLPLKNNDLPFVELPEDFRYQRDREHFPEVSIVSRLGTEQTWKGQIVRTESAIDDISHQLYVVAQIDDPYGLEAEGKRPLKIGQYVTAQIKGSEIENAIVIPNSAVYQGTYVYVVEDGLLQRRDIQIAWQSSYNALVSQGLEAGEKLVLTSLGQVSSGTRVNIEGEAPKQGKPRNRPSQAGDTEQAKRMEKRKQAAQTEEK